MSSVTVNITTKNHVNNLRYNLIKEGTLIRIKGWRKVKKRIWGEVIKVNAGYEQMGLAVKAIYRPAPKSKLNNRNVFSKNRMKIIKLTEPDKR